MKAVVNVKLLRPSEIAIYAEDQNEILETTAVSIKNAAEISEQLMNKYHISEVILYGTKILIFRVGEKIKEKYPTLIINYKEI